MKTRSLVLLSSAAFAALLLAPVAADARSARLHHPGTTALTRPRGTADGSAAGDIRIRPGHGGDRLLVRLRGLGARHGYDLRTADTGSTLGRVLTNRRGSGSLRLRDAGNLAGATLEVVDEDSGDTVLDGQAPDPSVTHDAVREADAALDGTGASGVLHLRSDQTTGSERMRIEAVLPADGSFDVFMDDGTGTMTSVGTLTLGSDHGNGTTSHHSANHVRDHRDGTGSGDSGSGGDTGDAGDTGDTGTGDANDTGDTDDANDGDDDDAGTGTTGAAVFTWSVDTADGTKLPFDAATLDDLAGRAIEIRDANGSTVLSGTVPALTDSQDDDGQENDGTDDGNDGTGDTGGSQQTGDHQDTGSTTARR